jgi:hypothetical protein
MRGRLSSDFTPVRDRKADRGSFLRFIKPRNSFSKEKDNNRMPVQDTYPMPIAVKAAGFKSTMEFRRQVYLGPLSLQSCDKESTGSGVPVGYSRNRILQAAFMKKLTPLGLTAAAAARHAFVFTDQFQPDRAAGQLYPEGRTILVVTAEGAKVVNTNFDVTLTDATDRAETCLVIDCNQIVQQVDAVLNNESSK